MATKKTIGEMIKELRKGNGFSQTELANKSKVSIASIKRLESNQRENLSIKLLDDILNALDVNIQDVLMDYNILFEKSNEINNAH